MSSTGSRPDGERAEAGARPSDSSSAASKKGHSSERIQLELSVSKPLPPGGRRKRSTDRTQAAVIVATEVEHTSGETIAERINRNLYSLTSFLISLIVHTAVLVLLAMWIRLPVGTISTRLEAALVAEPSLTEPKFDTETIEIALPDLQQSPLEREFNDMANDQLLEAASSETVSVAPPADATSPSKDQPLVDTGAILSRPNGGGLQGRNKENRARLAARNGATEASEAAVEKGLKWLSEHQTYDGSWRLKHNHQSCDNRCRNPGSIESPNAATGLALMAFLGAGYTHQQGAYQDQVGRGLNYLKRRLRKTKFGGTLVDDSMYAHGIATIALAEAYSMTKDQELRETVELAVQYIVSAQHARGGWRYHAGQPGDMTVTGWQLMALKSAQMAGIDVPQEVFDKASQFLDSLADSDGAYYGYQSNKKKVTTTAIGLLMRMYLGWPRSKGLLDRGADSLLDHGPSKNNIYYNYYATQVLHHLSSEQWPQWNAQLRDYLIATQFQKGHEEGSWFFVEEHGSVGGRLYTTAMAIMILEVYYRYMPLYGSDVVNDD